MMSGRRRRLVRASVRPVRFFVTPGAQFVAKLPGLRIGALSMAAFEFAESVTLAQLIAGAECEFGAGARR